MSGTWWRTVLAMIVLVAMASAQWRLADWPVDPFMACQQLPLQPVAQGGTRILVVDGQGKPVAGSDVFVVDLARVPDGLLAQLETWFGDDAWLVLVSKYGARWRTEATGSLEVLLPQRYLCGAVESATSAKGRLFLGQRIVLGPACAIVPVEVVDSDQRPSSGLLVDVRAADKRGKPVVSTGITDTGGRARLRVPIAPNSRRARDGQLVVGARHLDSGDPCVVTSAHLNGRAGLLQLRVPPWGSLRLSTFDASGRPLAASHAHLRCGSETTLPIGRDASAFLFAPIPLGADIEAFVTAAGASGSDHSMRLTPLAQSGETERRFVIGADELVLVGRLLDAEGVAVANRKVYVRIHPEFRRDPWLGPLALSVQTGEEGRFSFVPGALVSTAGAARFEFRIGDGQDSSAAVLTFPMDRLGIVDVGELRARKANLLVGGEVVDEHGEPVVGALVEVTSSWWAGAPYPVWLTARTGKRGAFEVYESAIEGAEVEVLVRTPGGMEPAKARVTAGTRGVRVTMRRLVRWQMRLSEPFAVADAFEVRLVQPGKADLSLVATLGAIDDPVPPGKFDVQLRMAGQHVLWIPAVEVGNGKDDVEAAIRTVDWRQYLELATLRVGNGAGEPIRANVIVMGAPFARIHGASDGVVDVPLVNDRRVVVCAPGYRHERLSLVPGTHAVELRPRARLRLRLPGGLDLPAGVSIELPATDVPGAAAVRVDWLPNRENVLSPDGDGEVTLTLFAGTGRQVLHTQRVEVPVDDVEREVVLQIDASVVEAAKQAVRSAR